jgi:hypothetical protein
MHSSMQKFTVALNYVLLFWKLLAFGCMLVILNNFLCSVSALLVMLFALQPIMLFVGTKMYLEPNLCLLNIFYNLYS